MATHSTNSIRGFPFLFSIPSLAIVICRLFNDGHSDQYEVVPHCSFDMHFSEIFLVAQMVKCLPATWETRVRSLGREDPLEKEMAAHSSTLAWRIPWREEPCRLQSTGLRRVGHDWAASLSLSLSPRYVDVLPSVYPCTFSRTWSCLADEAAMNICVLIFGRISASIFLGFVSSREMADNMTAACSAF